MGHSMEAAGSSALKQSSKKKKTEISKHKQECGKRNFNKIALWLEAKREARAVLGISGFCGFKCGSPEYQRARDIYATLQRK